MHKFNAKLLAFTGPATETLLATLVCFLWWGLADAGMVGDKFTHFICKLLLTVIGTVAMWRHRKSWFDGEWIGMVASGTPMLIRFAWPNIYYTSMAVLGMAVATLLLIAFGAMVDKIFAKSGSDGTDK